MKMLTFWRITAVKRFEEISHTRDLGQRNRGVCVFADWKDFSLATEVEKAGRWRQCRVPPTGSAQVW